MAAKLTRDVWVDLIVNKRATGRAQDLADFEKLLAVASANKPT